MTVECNKCSMKEECICIPSSDECDIRKQSYNTAINDFAERLKEKSTSLKFMENDYYGYVSEDEIDEIAEQMKAGGIDG